jgi:hypothetical protein
LVRKLDIYMLVCLFPQSLASLSDDYLTSPSLSCGLCTFSTSSTAMPWSMGSSTPCQRI